MEESHDPRDAVQEKKLQLLRLNKSKHISTLSHLSTIFNLSLALDFIFVFKWMHEVST